MEQIILYMENNPDVVIAVMITMLLLLIVAFVLLVINTISISKLKKKYNSFLRGQDGESLENILLQHIDEIDHLVASNEINKKNIAALNSQIKFAFQKLGVVKYDALDEFGGKLSFTICLLNDKNDGYVLNAVHSRDGCYTYVKEIIGAKSVIPLSDEEIEAIRIAINYQK